MQKNKVRWAIGLAMLTGLLSACTTPTKIGISSEPSRAWVYTRVGDPEFHAMAGVGKDGHRETPTSIVSNWIGPNANTCEIKVIWPDDGIESKVVTLKRNSPNVSILFIKDQEPQVSEK